MISKSLFAVRFAQHLPHSFMSRIYVYTLILLVLSTVLSFLRNHQVLGCDFGIIDVQLLVTAMPTDSWVILDLLSGHCLA